MGKFNLEQCTVTHGQTEVDIIKGFCYAEAVAAKPMISTSTPKVSDSKSSRASASRQPTSPSLVTSSCAPLANAGHLQTTPSVRTWEKTRFTLILLTVQAANN